MKRNRFKRMHKQTAVYTLDARGRLIESSTLATVRTFHGETMRQDARTYCARFGLAFFEDMTS